MQRGSAARKPPERDPDLSTPAAREIRSSAPRVTVFMAVHDRAATVGAAIRSVLAQRFRDFELVVLDDGSTDGSAEVAARFDDPRIRLVRHEENQGIPRTRNHGLVLARGEYLAILDSDDVAHPRRLERQVAFLDARPDVAAVGSWAHRVRPDGRRAPPAVRPTAPREIRARIPFTTCFKNPTMTARTAVLREFGYREEFVICQDIDLWSRVSAKYALANLPRFLVEYRLGGTSHRDPALAARLKKRAAAEALRELHVAIAPDDLDGHYRLRNPKNFRFAREDVDRAEEWLMRLVDANARLRVYPEPEFTRAAAERWWRMGLVAVRCGVPATRLLRSNPLSRALPAVLSDLLRLTARRLPGPRRARA